MAPHCEPSTDHYRRILGVLFYVGPVEGLIERTMRGGLIVVPSAPVLVNMTADPVHRQAVETSDVAITDSGFMVLLWRLFARERIIRISGLRYIRALLDDPRFRQSRRILWIMPSKQDEIGNRAWLIEQGMTVEESDCYLAPFYAREGPLEDPTLLALIREKRPQFVMINLGGNVQERLGLYLRDALRRDDGGTLNAEISRIGGSIQQSAISDQPSLPAMPALICTGAAIAFLSNRQVNIPTWVDRLFLGWLVRILSSPTKFFPRYWQSLRLAKLVWKYGSRSVGEANT